MNNASPRAVHPLAAATLTFLAMAGVWAALVAVVRWPMNGPGLVPPAQAFVLAGAVMLTWVATTSRVATGRWRSHAPVLLTTLAVLFSPTLVWVLGGAASATIYAILAIAWCLGLRELRSALKRLPLWETLAALALGVTLGVVYFLLVNTKGYANVFSPEQTLLGVQHRDTMYQASIAAMLGSFAAPSTGLDGLVPVQYHMLSHALVGVTGRWMGVPPIHAYYLVPQIVGIPLLFFSLTAATCSLWRPSETSGGTLLAVLLPVAALLTFEIWDWASYLVSESYAHAVTLLLFSVPLLTDIHERREDKGLWLRAVALAVAGFGLMLAKSSVGVLFATGVLYVFARAYGLLSRRLAACGVVTALIMFVGIRVTVGPANTTASLWGPGHFVTAYRDAAWPNILAIALTLALAPFAWIGARTSSTRRVAIETLAIMTVASVVSGLLLRVGAGAAYYFLNVGVWTGLTVACGAALLPAIDRRRWRHAAVFIALAVSVVTLLGHDDKRNAGPALAALARQLETVALGTPVAVRSNSLGRAHVAGAVARTPGSRMAAAIAKAVARAPGRPVVFVPPGNTAFWTLHALCTAPPFFVPAVTGLPLVLGLPPDEDTCPLPLDTGFGYAAYAETSRSALMSDDSLCAKLKTIDFDTALVVETPDTVRTVVCR